MAYTLEPPRGVYPAKPSKFSFGDSPIVFLKEKWGFEVGHESVMENISRYPGVAYAVRGIEDEWEEIKDPDDFKEGIDFDWV